MKKGDILVDEFGSLIQIDETVKKNLPVIFGTIIYSKDPMRNPGTRCERRKTKLRSMTDLQVKAYYIECRIENMNLFISNTKNDCARMPQYTQELEDIISQAERIKIELMKVHNHMIEKISKQIENEKKDSKN